MEVEVKEVKAAHKKMIKEYWPLYYRKTIILTVGMEFLLTAVVIGALMMVGMPTEGLGFWIIIVAVLVGSVSVNIILINQVTLPLKNLASALTNVSGEQSDVVPPNPNARRYEKSGFKPLLQYLYENASGAHADTNDSGDKEVKLLSQAFDQTHAGIIVLDSAGAIQYANKHAPISLGPDNTKHLDLLFEDENALDKWLASVRDTQVHAEKTWLRVPNKVVGEEDRRIFDVAATFEKGSKAEIVLVLFDQSAEYQPEDDALDFIAFAAHELRGPITVIRGYLDVLDIETEGILQSDQHELIKRLIVSANRLSSYINNILNASRYDRRHLKLHLVEDNIADIYDTINDDMVLRAQSQNRLLSIEIPRDLPTVAADRSSLSEVIGNLIDNAIKYSNEGGLVRVTAGVDGDSVKVFVEDHGIGIPSSVISNLFHKFYRSHRSRETVAGTGIGLYICKAIVESHGGTVGVTSAEGQGSTFSFSVPIYATVKDKLLAGDSINSNAGIISTGGSWIKNHSMYKG